MDNNIIYAFIGFTIISNLGLIYTVMKSIVDHSNKVQKIDTTQEFIRIQIQKLEKDMNALFKKLKT